MTQFTFSESCFQKMKGAVIVFMLAAFFGSSVQAEGRQEDSKSSLNLGLVRVAQVSQFQHEGNYFSGGIYWSPQLQLNESYGIRLSLGGTLLGDQVGSKFLALEETVLLDYRFSDVTSVEVGPSGRTWFNNGGMILAAELNVAYHPTWNRLPYVPELFMGYSSIFLPHIYTGELKAGVGLEF